MDVVKSHGSDERRAALKVQTGAIDRLPEQYLHSLQEKLAGYASSDSQS
jgi:hypothetical protein